MEKNRETDHWVFDRRIPIALVFGFIMQIFGFGWWASNLDARIQYCENSQEKFVDKNWAVGEHAVINAELTHNAEAAISIKQSILRMEDKIDKVYNVILKK